MKKKDMSKGELLYAKGINKTPMTRKKASSFSGRYYINGFYLISGSDSQLGFNYAKRKKHKK